MVARRGCAAQPASDGSTDNRSGTLILLLLVLVELRYMNQNRKLLNSVETALADLRLMPDVVVMDFTEEVSQLIDLRLDIHDAIIVATALHFQQVTGESVHVITKDRKIIASGLVNVVW